MDDNTSQVVKEYFKFNYVFMMTEFDYSVFLPLVCTKATLQAAPKTKSPQIFAEFDLSNPSKQPDTKAIRELIDKLDEEDTEAVWRLELHKDIGIEKDHYENSLYYLNERATYKNVLNTGILYLGTEDIEDTNSFFYIVKNGEKIASIGREEDHDSEWSIHTFDSSEPQTKPFIILGTIYEFVKSRLCNKSIDNNKAKEKDKKRIKT